jgi:hypothetical protein
MVIKEMGGRKEPKRSGGDVVEGRERDDHGLVY